MLRAGVPGRRVWNSTKKEKENQAMCGRSTARKEMVSGQVLATPRRPPPPTATGTGTEAPAQAAASGVLPQGAAAAMDAWRQVLLLLAPPLAAFPRPPSRPPLTAFGPLSRALSPRFPTAVPSPHPPPPPPPPHQGLLSSAPKKTHNRAPDASSTLPTSCPLTMRGASAGAAAGTATGLVRDRYGRVPGRLAGRACAATRAGRLASATPTTTTTTTAASSTAAGAALVGWGAGGVAATSGRPRRWRIVWRGGGGGWGGRPRSGGGKGGQEGVTGVWRRGGVPRQNGAGRDGWRWGGGTETGCGILVRGGCRSRGGTGTWGVGASPCARRRALAVGGRSGSAVGAPARHPPPPPPAAAWRSRERRGRSRRAGGSCATRHDSPPPPDRSTLRRWEPPGHDLDGRTAREKGGGGGRLGSTGNGSPPYQ